MPLIHSNSSGNLLYQHPNSKINTVNLFLRLFQCFFKTDLLHTYFIEKYPWEIIVYIQEKFSLQEKYAKDVFDPANSFNIKRSTIMPSDLMLGGNEVLDLSDKESSGKFII